MSLRKSARFCLADYRAVQTSRLEDLRAVHDA